MTNLNTEPLNTNQTIVDDPTRIGTALNLSSVDIERVIQRQQEKNILFGEAAKELGLISDKDLQRVLSGQFGFSYASEGSSDLNEYLIAAHQPFSDEVEKIKTLRSQLLIRWINDGNKIIAVTSTKKQDNASILTANLAIVFSQLNKKTLLIDANLREPVQHKLFSVQSKLGLANILANRKGQYELTAQKSLPNLSVLTAGTEAPNPQELLSRDGLEELLADLEKVYDVIIIDTSPSHVGLDYLSVISKVKASVIVARKNLTSYDDLNALKTQIENANAEIIGSVLLSG